MVLFIKLVTFGLGSSYQRYHEHPLQKKLFSLRERDGRADGEVVEVAAGARESVVLQPAARGRGRQKIFAAS